MNDCATNDALRMAALDLTILHLSNRLDLRFI
jgi:hypothetical protein